MKFFLFNILSLIIFLSLISSLNSCREEIDMDQTDTIETLPVELINTNISGQIKDKGGKVITEASIKLLNESTSSDENGYFIFEDIKADRNGTVIIVNKEGYLENRITVYPSLNHDLFSSIVLNEDNSAATMLSWEGGTIELGKYGTLHIFPNTLVYDQDGSNFEGNAEISFQIFDPDDENFEQLIPGDLTGFTGDKKKALIPGAAVQIRITDGKLHDLRLARGQSAELVLSVSQKYQSNWNEEIKFYHYDTNQDKWLNKGLAIQENENKYISEITEFGSLLFGSDHDVVKLEGNIHYEDDKNSARHTISLHSAVQLPAMIYPTDEQGYFTAWVPENEEVLMEVLNECGVKVLEEELGKLEEDTEIDKQLSSALNCRSLPVSGKLIDCAGEPVANGYVRITSTENDLFVLADNNGMYEGEFKVCSDEVTIDLTAYDRDRKAGTVVHSGYPVNDTIRIGDWKVCETEGYSGLQFKNSYYFLNEEIYYTHSSGVLLYLGSSEDISMDCLINDFRGEDDYYIYSTLNAEFIPSVNALHENAPQLILNSDAFETFKLHISNYSEDANIAGTIIGLAKNANNNNEEGLMFIKFSVPFEK